MSSRQLIKKTSLDALDIKDESKGDAHQHFQEAQNLLSSSKVREAFNQFQQCINIYTKFNCDSIEAAKAFYHSGSLNSDFGFYKDAETYLKKGLVIVEKEGKQKHLELFGQIQHDLGALYIKEDRFHEAIDALKEALQVFGSQAYKNSLISAQVSEKIGEAYGGLGQYEKAFKILKESLQMYIQSSGHESKGETSILCIMSRLHSRLGHTVEAQAFLERALLSEKKRMKKDDQKLGLIHQGLGLIKLKESKFQEANEYLQKSLEYRKKHYGENKHVDVARSMASFAALSKAQEQHEKTSQLYQEAIDYLKDYYGDYHFYTAEIYRCLGYFYKSLNKLDQAQENFATSLQVKVELYGKDHFQCSLLYQEVADCLFEKKKYTEAYKNYKTCINLMSGKGMNQLPLADCFIKMIRVNQNGYKVDEITSNFKGALQVFVEICDDSVIDAIRLYPMEMLVEVYNISASTFDKELQQFKAQFDDIKKSFTSNKEIKSSVEGKIQWLKKKFDSASTDKLFGWMCIL